MSEAVKLFVHGIVSLLNRPVKSLTQLRNATMLSVRRADDSTDSLAN